MDAINNQKAYNSNVGLTTGAVIGTLGGAAYLYKAFAAKESDSFMKSMVDAAKQGASAEETRMAEDVGKIIGDSLKRYKKYSYITAGAAFLTAIGCGYLVDKLRNNSAKEADEQINQYGSDAWKVNSEINVTEMGAPYYKSNKGLKWGALLGAGCGVLAGFLGCKQLPKELATSSVKTMSMVGSAISMAIGGLAVGALTDHITNKNAKNDANKRLFA